MNKQVLVIDSVGDILMESRFRDSHYKEMRRRGWIQPNEWIQPRSDRCTICTDKLIEFFKEATLRSQ